MQGANEKGKTEDKAKTGTQNQYQTNDQAKYFNVDAEQFEMPQELEMSLYDRTEDKAPYSEELGQVEMKEIDHITMLREYMDFMLQEFEQSSSSIHWNKLDVSTWLRKIGKIQGISDIETGKPAEHMLAHLIETNIYLTRKLTELEAKLTPPTQIISCDPTMIATPMTEQRQLSWVTIASQPAKPKQMIHTKLGKPALQKEATHATTADLRCLIIQVNLTIDVEERPNGIDTRKEINEMLEHKGIPQYF